MKYAFTLLFVGLCASCSYDAGVDYTCDREGAVSGDAVCSGGYWVASPGGVAEPPSRIPDGTHPGSSQPPAVIELPVCDDCGVSPLHPILAEPPVGADSGLRLRFDQPAAEDIDNFPALVSLVDPMFQTMPDGSVPHPRFYTIDGEEVPHEIETFDPTSGAFVAWVHVPTLRADGSTVIDVIPGERDLRGARDVWEEFEMVFHMQTVQNSVDGRDAKNEGTTSAVGIIGGARAFDGIEQHIDTENETDLDQWSIAMWVNAENMPMASDQPNGPLMREDNYQIIWDDDDLAGTAAVRLDDDVYDAPFGDLEAGRWLHLAATFDGVRLRTYLNGQLMADNEVPDEDVDDTNESAMIGRVARGRNADSYFAGMIDEIRVSPMMREPSWFDASYRNQADPGAFYSITVLP